MIVEDDVASVRDKVSLVDIVSEHTSLRRVGRRWQGLCPFHAENTPSFSVNAEQGLYLCFGCGAKGDVITFVRDTGHLDFVGAVERLASRAGVVLRYTDPKASERRQTRQRLHDALDRAVTWYHDRLLTGVDAEPARVYLAERGIGPEVQRQWRLGWAPDGRTELAAALNLPTKVFVDSGLGWRHDNGRVSDAFRSRIVFPIFDVAGLPVGFGARILPGGNGPKYKNSGDGPLYRKSRVLYGLDLARAAIVGSNRVVLCEGYTDVIGLAAAGVPEAVATCGTALTEDHVKVLAAYTRRVVLAFDADTAGRGAAAKVYEWEREHGLDVRVVELPAGQDPGDMARANPGGLRAAVDGAQPFLGWRIDRVLTDVEPTPEARARVVETVAGMLREHPSQLVRDQYVTRVADRLGLDRPQVAAAVHSGRRRGRVEPEAKPRQTRTWGPEIEAVRLLVDQPGVAVHLWHTGLFADDRARAVWDAYLTGGSPYVPDLLDQLDADTGDWLRRVTAESTDADPADVLGLLLRAAVRRRLEAGEVPAGEVPAVKLMVEALDRDPDGSALAELDRWVRTHDMEDTHGST